MTFASIFFLSSDEYVHEKECGIEKSRGTMKSVTKAKAMTAPV